MYQEEVERLACRLECLRKCRHIRCYPDPPGKRIGSGGATLNALHLAKLHLHDVDILCSKTLIIHSGGDSKRAPFHSVCGKAWATLNSDVNGDIFATPLSLLLIELSSIVSRIPAHSVTVASCDVLLDFSPRGDSAFELHSVNIPDDAVTVIAVPESPGTAKNHVRHTCVFFSVRILLSSI